MATRSSYLAADNFPEIPFFSSGGSNRNSIATAANLTNGHSSSNAVSNPYLLQDAYAQRQHPMAIPTAPEFQPEQDDNAAKFAEEVNHVHAWFRERRKPEQTATLCTLLKRMHGEHSRILIKELEKKLAGDFPSPAWPFDMEHEMSAHLDMKRSGQDHSWLKNSRHSFALGDIGVDNQTRFHSLLSVPATTTSSLLDGRPRSWADDDPLSAGLDRLHLGNDTHRRGNLTPAFPALRETDGQDDRFARAAITLPPRSPLLASPQPPSLAGKQRFPQTLPPPSSSVSSHVDWVYRHDHVDPQPNLLSARTPVAHHYAPKTNPMSATPGAPSAAASSAMIGASAVPLVVMSPSGAQSKDRKQSTEANRVDMELLEDVPAWLRSLRLHKYNPIFEHDKWQTMIQLNDDQLLKRGVAAKGARDKLHKVFKQVRLYCDQHQIPYQ